MADQHPLNAFLRERKVDGRTGQITSLTGMGNMKGKWGVSDEDYTTFLDKLHDYLFVKKYRPQNLVEQRRPDNLTPLLIDLDFKYSSDSALTRSFNETHIKNFIELFIETLNEFYDMSSLGSIRFFVTLRPLPYEQRKLGGVKNLKDGVHIVCPDFVLPAEHQRIIRMAMIDRQAVTNAFDGTGYINEEKDIYDESIVKKAGWFFYGESKPDIHPYKLTHIYNYNIKKNTMKNEDIKKYTDRQLLEILSIRYNLKKNDIVVREEMEEKWNDIHTIINRPEPAAPPASTTAQLLEDNSVRNQVLDNVETVYRQDEIYLARRLALECLSEERANGFTTWLEVGWCLRTIEPSEEMFDTWMDFSRKSPKFSSNNTEQLRREWNRNWGRDEGSNKLKLGSLRMWAKEDNPEAYKEIVEENIVDFIENNTKNTHNHVARLMKKIFQDKYVASIDSKRTEWYEFKNNTWKHLVQGVELRNKISTDVVLYVLEAKKRVLRKISEMREKTPDDLITKIQEQKLKELNDLEKHLHSADFKGSVMKEASGIFYEEEFMEKLNSNSFTLGVANGIINLHSTGTSAATDEYKVEYRQGKATDHISFQIGKCLPEYDAISYAPYDPTNPIYEEIDDFFAKVFPRADLRAYVWRLLASCLEGANKEQCFYIWIGVGGNGKSKLVELMRIVLGDYCCSLQSTALTRKRPESGAANPDIMAIRNKRFIYLQEPDDREPLNTSRMKQFSGEDVVEARGLFEDQTRFKVVGKLHMMCNRLPPITTMDRGTWRRVRVIPFESKFVEPGSPEIDPKKNVYPRDDHLDQKLGRWREAVFARLLHIYETEYLKTGLAPIPPIVTQASEQYKESFDIFSKFFKACVRQGGNAIGAETPLKDFLAAYKSWHEENGTGPKLAQTELTKRLTETLGEPQGGKAIFRHVRVFKYEEDAEEFDKEMSESREDDAE